MIQRRVTINQPCPFPPMYLLRRMLDSDIVVQLDSALFVRKTGRSFRHYEILLQGKRHKLAIPVKHGGHQDIPLHELQIDYEQGWVKSHLGTLRHAYGKAPFFEEAFHAVHSVFDANPVTLAEFSNRSLESCFAFLNRWPTIVSDQDVIAPIVGDPSRWMMEIVLALGGTEYVCGQSAASVYLKEEEFAKAGIKVEAHFWHEPTYPRAGNVEEQGLSILDVMFWLGRRGSDTIEFAGVHG